MKRFELSAAEVDRLTRRIFLAGAVLSSVLTAAFVGVFLFLLTGGEEEPGSSSLFWTALGAFVVLDLALWAILLRPVLRLRKKGAALLIGGNALSMELAGRVRELPLISVERAVFHGDGFAVSRIELVAKGGKPVTLRGFEDMDGLAKALSAELSPSVIERKRNHS